LFSRRKGKSSGVGDNILCFPHAADRSGQTKKKGGTEGKGSNQKRTTLYRIRTRLTKEPLEKEKVPVKKKKVPNVLLASAGSHKEKKKGGEVERRKPSRKTQPLKVTGGLSKST